MADSRGTPAMELMRDQGVETRHRRLHAERLQQRRRLLVTGDELARRFGAGIGSARQDEHAAIVFGVGHQRHLGVLAAVILIDGQLAALRRAVDEVGAVHVVVVQVVEIQGLLEHLHPRVGAPAADQDEVGALEVAGSHVAGEDDLDVLPVRGRRLDQVDGDCSGRRARCVGGAAPGAQSRSGRRAGGVSRKLRGNASMYW